MAKGRKTGGLDVQPGQVLNPNGRPVMPEHMKKARKMNKQRFEEILQKYIHMNMGELTEALGDKETSALDLIVIKVLVEGIKRGDEKRLDFVLCRLIGKVSNVHQFDEDPRSALLDRIKERQAEDAEPVQP